MKILDLIQEDTIELNLKARSKKDVINELAALLGNAGNLHDLQGFIQEVLAREDLSTTGVGHGVAIPHAKSKYVKESSLAFGRSSEGIDYESMDGQDAYIFFLIAVPKDAANLHLKTLAKLSRKLVHKEFRKALQEAKTKEEVLETLSIIDKEEEK